MRHSLFLVIVWGIIAGIFIASLWHIPFVVEVLVFLVSLALALSALFSDQHFSRKEIKKYSFNFLLYIFLLSISLGSLRYVWFTSEKGDQRFASRVGETVTAEGIIVEEPAVKDSYVQLIVLLDHLGQEKIKPTKVLIMDDPYSKRTYGDRINVKGKLTRPENFASENGRTFDYVSYLAKDKIFYTFKYTKLELVSQNNGNIFKRVALALKRSFTRSLEKALPYLEARLASGLTVAGKYALPKNVQNEFIKTGTIQVVVLSGYNVTIIAEAVMSALSFLPQLAGAGLGALTIIFFACATGGSATIIRAVIMALIVLLGKISRRNYKVGRALLVAGFLMLMQNPMLLVFDASFQLSFIATAGLIYFTPIASSYLTFLSDENKFKNVIASTVATQIFVTPFILYLTGIVSVVALPANLFLSLLIPLTMFLSFITGVIGFVFPLLATVAGYGAYVFLKLMLTTVHIFSILPGASFTLSSFPLWAVAFAYCIYGLVFWKYRKTQHSFLKSPRVAGPRDPGSVVGSTRHF